MLNQISFARRARRAPRWTGGKPPRPRGARRRRSRRRAQSARRDGRDGRDVCMRVCLPPLPPLNPTQPDPLPVRAGQVWKQGKGASTANGRLGGKTLPLRPCRRRAGALLGGYAESRILLAAIATVTFAGVALDCPSPRLIPVADDAAWNLTKTYTSPAEPGQGWKDNQS